MPEISKKTTHVGKLIREKRVERGIKQQAVSNWLGVTQSCLSRMEYGRTNLSLEQATIICGRLGIMPRELFHAALNDRLDKKTTQ